MRKIVVSIFAVLVSSMTLMAERVSREDASLVANHFMNVAAPASADGVKRIAPAKRMVLKESPAQTESQYYVYENENGEGWVIIAANDAVRPILAYSETGHFRTDNMPSNIRHWMGKYDQFIKRIETDGVEAAEETKAEWRALRKGVRKAKAVVVGPLIQYLFAMKLDWFPTSGWFTEGLGWKTIILPSIALSFAYYADIARLTRSSMLETLRSDYIRTAKAKGMRQSVIIFKHAMKGAMLPIVSYLGPAFAGIITGSIVVEQVFRVPGLGKFFVQSSFNRDYTLIVGVVIVYSAILIVMNFIVDVVYAQLDPRITYK